MHVFRFQPRGRKGKKVVEFKKTPDALYAYTPDSKFLQTVMTKKRLTPPDMDAPGPQMGKHDGDAHGGNRPITSKTY
jgi:hypothetical protein